MSTEVFSAVAGDITDQHRPVVVLCHGSMDRSAGMLRLSRELSARASVIRYDRRGYARSGEVGPPFDIDAQVDDLVRVLDRHTAGRPVSLAFGHSFGGNVVLALAARQPARVERVAVYETPMSWFDWWPRNTAGGAAVAANDPDAAAEAFMRRLIGDERWNGLPEATRASRRTEGPAMMAELADLRRSAPWDAARVRCPVLAICGELGRPHHQRGMQLLAEMIDGAEFAQLAAAGHGAPTTHPTALAALLEGWLDRVAPG